jgi:hypothetical protein
MYNFNKHKLGELPIHFIIIFIYSLGGRGHQDTREN